MEHKRIDAMYGYELDKRLYELYEAQTQSSGGNFDRAKAILHEAIDEVLTPNQAEVLTLYYFDRLKQREVAERLHRSQATVSRTLKRARARLANALRYTL